MLLEEYLKTRRANVNAEFTRLRETGDESPAAYAFVQGRDNEVAHLEAALKLGRIEVHHG